MPTFLVGLAVIHLLSAVLPVGAQEPGNRAGLVVVHPDGRVVTQCVAFDEPSISGTVLLQRSGLSYVTAAGPMGVTVCSLNGEGCPATACWCKCQSSPCAYWNYYHGTPDGAWSYATLGAAARTLGPGDVDAWMWGDGSGFPPSISFSSICAGGETAVTVPSPTVDVTPTGTPVPASPTAPMTSTPTPTALAPTATTARFTATPQVEVPSTPEPPTPSPSPEPTATSLPTALPFAPTALPSPSATPTAVAVAGSGAGEKPGTAREILAFVAILGVLGAVFFFARRRQGG